MWRSLHRMRYIHCAFRRFLLFSVGWNVVQAVTYCSPSRKDHCISLSLLIIFMHKKKKSWLKSCWAGLISSPQWSGIKTKRTERKKKNPLFHTAASINTIYLILRVNCRQTRSEHTLILFCVVHTCRYSKTFMNCWWWLAKRSQTAVFLNSSLHHHRRGLYQALPLHCCWTHSIIHRVSHLVRAGRRRGH